MTIAREVPTRRLLSHELRASLRWDLRAVDKKKSGTIVTCVRGLVTNTEHAPPVSTLGTVGIRKYPDPTGLEKP